MFIKRKLFILCSLCFGVSSYAADFKFESIKRDADGVTLEEKKNNVGKYKEIIVSGYGITEKKALENAFRSAIQQYVGVVIDSETQMKNGQLIKDNILTASNGYIQEYKKLSQKNTEGIFEIEIKAVVKSQKIYDKVKSLNIDVLTLNNTKNIQARVATKVQSKEEVSKILEKSLKDFLSAESLQEMIYVKIDGAKILEDKAKEGKVPLQIKHSIGFDLKVYANKVAQLEQVFENLGAKLHKRVDLPYLEKPKSGYVRVKNIKKVQKIEKNSICIIKKYGQGYKTDIWNFPGASLERYPFKVKSGYNKDLNIPNLFNRIIEVKGSSSVLYSVNFKLDDSVYRLMSNIHHNADVYGTGWDNKYIKCISPLFHNAGWANLSIISTGYSGTAEIPMPIDTIESIKAISIELEEI